MGHLENFGSPVVSGVAIHLAVDAHYLLAVPLVPNLHREENLASARPPADLDRNFVSVSSSPVGKRINRK
jgi:hypothetical protein